MHDTGGQRGNSCLEDNAVGSNVKEHILTTAGGQHDRRVPIPEFLPSVLDESRTPRLRILPLEDLIYMLLCGLDL